MMFTFKVRKLGAKVTRETEKEREQKSTMDNLDPRQCDFKSLQAPAIDLEEITWHTREFPPSKLACEHVCRAYSWLLVNAGETNPLWTVPSEVGLGYIRKLVPALHSLHDGPNGNKSKLLWLWLFITTENKLCQLLIFWQTDHLK